MGYVYPATKLRKNSVKAKVLLGLNSDIKAGGLYNRPLLKKQ